MWAFAIIAWQVGCACGTTATPAGARLSAITSAAFVPKASEGATTAGFGQHAWYFCKYLCMIDICRYCSMVWYCIVLRCILVQGMIVVWHCSCIILCSIVLCIHTSQSYVCFAYLLYNFILRTQVCMCVPWLILHHVFTCGCLCVAHAYSGGEVLLAFGSAYVKKLPRAQGLKRSLADRAVHRRNLPSSKV